MVESLSKINIKITIHGKGEASAEFFRHLAPMTVNTIMMKMPIHGRVNRVGEDSVCVITQISKGTEKSRTSFRRGEISFLPLNGTICIFLKESKSVRPMNPIGRIASGIDILDKAGSGDTMSLVTA